MTGAEFLRRIYGPLSAARSSVSGTRFLMTMWPGAKSN